jgi:solute carrier family 35 (UDP-galactose transporter), member B1
VIGAQMAPPKSTTTAAILKLLICVAGIYSAYITQGVFQEKLATETFGPNGARFPALSTLNGFQSLACFMWAFLLLQLQAVLFGEK